MPALFNPAPSVTLYGASFYPRSNDEASAMGLSGTRNKEVRALTIAAFRVAQNSSQLSTAKMNKDLLLFLLAGSRTAFNYWIEERRLIKEGACYRLTPTGLAECQDTLLGRAGAYSTTEVKVQEWQHRILSGDQAASTGKTFTLEHWSQ